MDFFYLLSNKRCCMTLCCDLLFILYKRDVHRDYSLTLGFTPFYTYPSSQNWTLDFCVFSAVFLPLAPTILFSHSSAVSHLKPISNPYMDHIWVKDHPRCFNWACAISNPYQIHIWAIYGSPPLPKIGLWTLSPRFLRGFASS